MIKLAIVNELGEVMYWCEDLDYDTITDILCDNPEWMQRGVWVD